ncbi:MULTISPECIES: hypothetical protein [Thermococcus]|uniref:Uncharacterized protein n=1 Tax=Thermococcus barossii TaxID=54077 RepID=A0A2Z2MI62_9EURY|nr:MULTISPECIES: hypothetical protein [Thermococcus]ASJ05189.1 hypothetical protein A3L01_07320 [Thermococcus barossii]NJE76321.1 hypothetical protein [Thermococcus sp. ES12]
MRTFGLILVFLGFLLLLKEFQPTFLDWLRPYAPYIKDAFWGVTLIAFGLYMLTRRAARRLVLLLYLIYLLLYLVV